MNKHHQLLIAILLLSAIATAACGPSAGPGAGAGGSIKVGLALASTGFVALVGAQERDGALLVINQVNASGGIKGRQIQIIARDTASDPQRAVQVVQELQREGVVAIIGPATSGEAIAVREFANEFKIPELAVVGSPKYTAESINYAYRIYVNSLIEIETLLNYTNKKGLKKVAFLNEATAFGQGALDSTKQLKDKYGAEIMATEVFQTNDTDMTAQLLKIKGAKPDVIISYGTGLTTAVVMRQKKTLGIDTLLITSPNGGQLDVVKAAAGAADGALYASTYCDDDPAPHQIEARDRYLNTYGTNPGWPGILGYSAAQALVYALQTVADSGKPITGENVKAALDGMNKQLAMGQMKFSATVHELLDPNLVSICRVQGNQRVRVQL